MLHNLGDRIAILEEEYNEWLKDYCSVVLRIAANTRAICSCKDEYASFVSVSMNGVFPAIRKLAETKDDSGFVGLINDINFTSYRTGIIYFHDLFDCGGKVAIFVIETLINEKDFLKDIESDIVCNYIDAIIHNIKTLSLFVKVRGDETSNQLAMDKIVDYALDELTDIADDITEDLEFDPEMFIAEYSDEYDDESSLEADGEGNKDVELKKAKASRLRMVAYVKMAYKLKINIQGLKTNMRHFFDKLNFKRTLFYRSNLGKIDHMFKLYASEAMVLENELNGDPVKILMNNCTKYVANLINGTLKEYTLFEKHVEQLFSCNSFPDMVQMVNKRVINKNFKLLGDKIEPKHVRKALIKDLRYRIATIILTNNEIYGYTVESMVEKKYPPIYQAVISLFTYKAHEKAVEQSVGDIFDGPESFKIMGRDFKKVVLDASKYTSTKLGSLNLAADYQQMEGKLQRYRKDSKLSIRNGSDNKLADAKDSHKDLSKRLSVLKNVQLIYEAFVPIFMYVAKSGDVMYRTCMKIDFLCQDSIKAMLNIERTKSDTNYKFDSSKRSDKDTSVTLKEKNDKLKEIAIERKAKRKEIRKNAQKGYSEDKGDYVIRYK